MTSGVATPSRILHVDDDPDLAELTALHLEREADELAVETATSATAGLEQLSDTDFDCIVSDYDMPGKSGIEFLTAVRETYPDIPFILYTGKGSEEIASKAVSAGVTDYLQKETGQSQYVLLANRIRNAIDQYEGRLEAQRKRNRLECQREAILSMTTCEAVADGKFEQAVEHITETAASVLEVGTVNVWLFQDDDGQYLTCVDNYDATEDQHTKGTTLDAEQYPSYFSAMRDHVTIAAGDAFEDHRTRGLTEEYLEPLGIGALLDAPVRSEGEISGVVCHEHVGGPREWTDDEIQFASHVADIVMRAHRNRRHKRRRRRWQALFEDPQLLALRLDTDGTLVDVNRTALDYVAPSRQDVLDRPFWETPWCGTASTALRKQDIRQAADGQHVEFETEIPAPAGGASVVGVIRPVRDAAGDVLSLMLTAHPLEGDHRNH
jgi:CheY-like chemotaxis protein